MSKTESPWTKFPEFYQNEIRGEAEVFREKIAESEAKAGKQAKYLFFTGVVFFVLWALMKWAGMVESLSFLGGSSQGIYLCLWIAGFILAVVFLISGGEEERKEGNEMVLQKVIQFRGWERTAEVEKDDELRSTPLFFSVLNGKLSHERTSSYSLQMKPTQLTNHVILNTGGGVWAKVWEAEIGGKGTLSNDRSEDTQDRDFDIFKGVLIEVDLGRKTQGRISALSRRHVGGMKDMTVDVFGKFFEVSVCNESGESELMVFADDEAGAVDNAWIERLESFMAACCGGVESEKRLVFFMQENGKAYLAIDCRQKIFELDLVENEEALEPLKAFFDGVEGVSDFLAKG